MKIVNQTLKVKACGSCGTAHPRKFCNSCANKVCDLCMGGVGDCCIACEAAFPESLVTMFRSNQGSPQIVMQTLATTSCDCCGATTHRGKSREGYASTVCEHCIVGMEGCCLEYEVVSPVSQFSASSPPGRFLGSRLGSMSEESGETSWALDAFARHGSDSSQSTEAPAPCIEEDVRFGAGAVFPELLLQRQQEPAASIQNTMVSISHTTPEKSTTLEKSVTLMICNLPCRIRNEEILGAFDSSGFSNTYDFVHIPRGRGSGTIGYAFIHFPNSQIAEQFALVFENFQFPGRSSQKKCTVRIADKQCFNGQMHTGDHFGRARGVGPCIPTSGE